MKPGWMRTPVELSEFATAIWPALVSVFELLTVTTVVLAAVGAVIEPVLAIVTSAAAPALAVDV